MGKRWILVASLVTPVVLAVAAVYAWPLGEERLQATAPVVLDFAAATAQAERVAAADVADPRVLPQCRTIVRTHGARAARAVLLLHGYTDCTKQMDGLADHLFEQGYNVYAPRAPRHGFVLGEADPGLSATELVEYADQSMNIAAGLGEESGVIGISGGGVLATWLAEHRPDTVARLLVLSPFYRPSASQAPSLAIKPLTVLFGHRLLPDRTVSGTGQTLSGLAQYLRITGNIDDEAVNERLRTVAVVVSDGDDQIDREVAVRMPARLAEANGVTLGEQVLDASIGHDVVEATAPGVAGRTGELYAAYQSLYEN
ncbi:alpha/beta hydrolase [Actinoplanes derwentensis]|uniref:Carboxylesterase n=1 Tax=Actinoplanes derwentensis TaxID=113562 RepID=A0A1H1RVP8_9ACTN|nr:alpha/beta fold hydrolase [Actinoplanes derwentensis]GID84532.1 hypothetical protein Ade03nite_34560 [Actinoplanes derwentensis]SDS39626.1 carboxylesterase [Actinoplanes derwentensis]